MSEQPKQPDLPFIPLGLTIKELAKDQRFQKTALAVKVSLKRMFRAGDLDLQRDLLVAALQDLQDILGEQNYGTRFIGLCMAHGFDNIVSELGENNRD